MPSKRPSISSQAGPSQRRRREDTPESDDEPQRSQRAAETQTQGGGKSSLTAVQIHQCAAKLVRLAMFHEYQHKVLRRDIITQKVLPTNAKGGFNAVLERAQVVLRQKFGMELYELRIKSKGAGVDEIASETQTQTQAKPTRKKQKGKRLEAIAEDEEEEEEDDDAEEESGAATQSTKTLGSKTYILRSVLSEQIRGLMATPQPFPMFDAAGDRADESDHVDSGAIIAWDKVDGTGSGSVQMLGIRTVVLCLVMCMGRLVTDDHLHSMLKRLNLYRDTILPYTSPDAKEPPMTLDKYLDLLARQQYLEKVKIAGQIHGDESAAYEWRWGNREAEFSEQAASDWIIEVLTGDDDDDDDEDEEDEGDGGRAARDRQQKKEEARFKRLETLKKDIVRAAGGPLTSDR